MLHMLNVEVFTNFRENCERTIPSSDFSLPNLLGYYLVSDGLHHRFPLRVRDFPPDETSIVGAGIGYSQVRSS